MAISSPAQYCGLRLRRGTRIRELPEKHKVLQRWCEALGQEYPGQRLWPPESWSGVQERRSVCRRGRGALQAQRTGHILCPADGVEPVDGVLPDLGFVEGCCSEAVLLQSVAVCGTRLVPRGATTRLHAAF